MLESALNVAPMTWLETFGEIGDMLSVVAVHLPGACSTHIDVFEHDHEDDPVWKILWRKIPHRCIEELMPPRNVTVRLMPRLV